MIDASAATGIWWSRFREPKGQMQQRSGPKMLELAAGAIQRAGFKTC